MAKLIRRRTDFQYFQNVSVGLSITEVKVTTQYHSCLRVAMNNTNKSFEILRHHLNERLKKSSKFKNFVVGNEGHSASGKDHGKEGGIYKFTIYKTDEPQININHYQICRDPMQISEYRNLDSEKQKRFLNDIIEEIENANGDKS